MTIAIVDISTTEQLDREALTAVRGGILHGVVIPSPAPAAWTCPTPPQMPSFPNCFPFNGGGGDGPFPCDTPPTTQPAHVTPL